MMSEQSGRARSGSNHVNKQNLFPSRGKPKKPSNKHNIDKVTIARANPKKAGFLTMGKYGYAKKYYYWILGEDTLYHFSSENEENPKGEFPLSVYNSIHVDNVNEKKFIFELCSPEKTVCLRADCKASMIAWTEKIGQVQNELGTSKKYTTGRFRQEHSLYVKVWEAKDLLNAKDTFCTILANGIELARSITFWNTQSPHYFAEWWLTLPPATESITISIYDFRGKNNLLLGSVEIPLHFVEPKETISWHSLKGKMEGAEDTHLTLELSKTETQYKVIVHKVSGFCSNFKGSFSVVAKIPPSLESVYSTENSVNGIWKPQLTNWAFDIATSSIIVFEVYFMPYVKDSKDRGEVKIPKDFVGQVEIMAEDFEKRNKYDWELKIPYQGKLRADIKHTTTTVLDDVTYDELFILMCDDNMRLPKMLSMLAVRNPSAIAESLVKVFERRRVSVSFLKEILGDQIRQTNDPRVIFRANTLATKAFDSYLKLTCLPHLHKMIKPIITEMYKGKKPCELDTSRVDERSVKRNRANLIDYCDQVFTAICQSTTYLPLALRSIFEGMRNDLRAQFPNDDNVIYSGPSGFIFLRFLCPAILGPTLFGLATEHPQVSVARDLTLLAKTLQTLANLTVFGQKESFMTELNDFIISKQPLLKNFLNDLSGIPSTPIDEIPTAHTRINFGKEMAFLVEYIEEHMEELLQAYPNDSIVTRLQEVLVKQKLAIKAEEAAIRGTQNDDIYTSPETSRNNNIITDINEDGDNALDSFEASGMGEFVGRSKYMVAYKDPETLAEMLDIPGDLSNEEKLMAAVEALQENLNAIKKRYTKLQAKHMKLIEEHKDNEQIVQLLAEQTHSLVNDIAKLKEEETTQNITTARLNKSAKQ